MRNLIHSYRLLCVDDNATFLGLLQIGLESYGFEVTTAAHGMDALMRYDARSDNFNAIISDCDMPVMNGADFAVELRLRGYKGPIVAMSGHMTAGVRTALPQTGISRIHRKPFQVKYLVADLNILCGKDKEVGRTIASPSREPLADPNRQILTPAVRKIIG